MISRSKRPYLLSKAQIYSLEWEKRMLSLRNQRAAIVRYDPPLHGEKWRTKMLAYYDRLIVELKEKAP